MVLGGVSDEELILNEDTLYAEEPGGRDLLLDITKDFDKVVAMVRAGEYNQADDYIGKHWLGRSWPCYQPLGNLHLRFDGQGDATDYTRELDLSDATAHVRFRLNGVTFEREVFTSHPDDAIIIRLTADKPGALNFHVTLDSQHPTASMTSSGAREVMVAGQLPGIALRRTLEWVEERGEQWKYPEIWNQDGSRKPFAKQILYGDEVGGRGMRFQVRIRVLESDGKVASSKGGLTVTGARQVVIAVAAASSFNGYDKSPSRNGVDPSSRTLPVLQRVAAKSYAQLRAAHVADYQKLFNRVSLQLGEPGARSLLPTNERMLNYDGAADPSLAALYFQFGRYLLISCSRPGGQPANLQGLWNVDRIPPWASAYTVNINIQMNYWGAEVANLPETAEPLFQFVREMSVTGKRVATQMYHRPGWVMHHNTSIWRDAQPVDWNGYVSFWQMAGGWFCEHLWEHYQFSLDRQFLRDTAYPIMKGAAEFYDSWLTDDGKGRLITPICGSPENTFVYTNKGGQEVTGGLSMGCTLDMAVIRELFRNTIEAGKLLGVDAAWRDQLAARIAKLLPYQIGSRGQLLEYFKEFKESPPKHNTSPFYPLFPSDQITPRGTPALAAAEQKLMEERARTGGGFPAAWLACDWARLGNGDAAERYIEQVIRHSHPNLFNGSGAVFQIDANLGGMAAVPEMLLQSHTGEIELLPALPKAWPNGSVKGVRSRGGFEVDLAWRDRRLTTATIRSVNGTRCKVRYAGNTVELQIKPGESRQLSPELRVQARLRANGSRIGD
jgi:alpha-L-fucosidase 2